MCAEGRGQLAVISSFPTFCGLAGLQHKSPNTFYMLSHLLVSAYCLINVENVLSHSFMNFFYSNSVTATAVIYLSNAFRRLYIVTVIYT